MLVVVEVLWWWLVTVDVWTSMRTPGGHRTTSFPFPPSIPLSFHLSILHLYLFLQNEINQRSRTNRSHIYCPLNIPEKGNPFLPPHKSTILAGGKKHHPSRKCIMKQRLRYLIFILLRTKMRLLFGIDDWGSKYEESVWRTSSCHRNEEVMITGFYSPLVCRSQTDL
jgi:hypothetical protein